MAVAAFKGGQFAAARARLRESAELAVYGGGYPLRMIDILDQGGYLCAATGRPAEAITLWSARTAQCQAAGVSKRSPLDQRYALVGHAGGRDGQQAAVVGALAGIVFDPFVRGGQIAALRARRKANRSRKSNRAAAQRWRPYVGHAGNGCVRCELDLPVGASTDGLVCEISRGHDRSTLTAFVMQQPGFRSGPDRRPEVRVQYTFPEVSDEKPFVRIPEGRYLVAWILNGEPVASISFRADEWARSCCRRASVLGVGVVNSTPRLSRSFGNGTRAPDLHGEEARGRRAQVLGQGWRRRWRYCRRRRSRTTASRRRADSWPDAREPDDRHDETDETQEDPDER